MLQHVADNHYCVSLRLAHRHLQKIAVSLRQHEVPPRHSTLSMETVCTSMSKPRTATPQTHLLAVQNASGKRTGKSARKEARAAQRAAAAADRAAAGACCVASCCQTPAA